MEDKRGPTVRLPPVDQIGIVVKDIDPVVEYYTSLFGLGPFEVREVELKGFIYQDEPHDCRLRVAFTQSGLVQIELIQILEGQSPHSEFLQQKGEGLQHLRFLVKDCPAVLARLAEAGIKPVWHRGVPVFGYLNTDQIGGVMFELVDARQMKRREGIDE